MKIQISQENLSKGLSVTSRFANSKAQLPILGNILLSTRKTKLLLASTNLELSVCLKTSATIEEEGEITLPSKVISEIVSNLTPGIINLESEKEQLKIKAQGFSSNILGMNSNDFPKLPEEITKENSLNISRENLSRALSQVVFASSTDETRPILTGVLIVVEKDGLNLVATDGFRLSQKKIKQETKIESQVVVPRNTILEIMRLFDGEKEILIDFKSSENQLMCGVSDLVLSSRIISGDYPNFQKIIPTSSLYKISVNKEDLLRATKLASILARDSANIVKVKLSTGHLILTSESQTAGVGENVIDAKIEGLGEKDELEIAFNYRFIEEFLGSVASNDVIIKLSDSSSAAVFLDSKDLDYLHLIMPVKIQE